MKNTILLADNLEVLKQIETSSVDLIYIDPPFNTAKIQRRTSLQVVRDDNGDRNGFGGKRYRTKRVSDIEYNDIHHDYLGFLRSRLDEAHRVLADHGSLYFHIDYREGHYCKLLLDDVFGGREHFLNEIIWAYDYGGRPKTRWAAKHDNIFVYVKNPEKYFFDLEEVDRIEYMAPQLVGAKKAARGKAPTDTWWHTIVPTNSKEKTGYPTQKPLGILRQEFKKPTTKYLRNNRNTVVLRDCQA